MATEVRQTHSATENLARLFRHDMLIETLVFLGFCSLSFVLGLMVGGSL
jgi:hypothetical protein